MLLTFVELFDGKEQEDQGAISLCDGNFAVYGEEKHVDRSVQWRNIVYCVSIKQLVMKENLENVAEMNE